MGLPRRSSAAAVLLSLGWGVAEAEAAVLRVPQDYPAIQAAINAAVSGDTVLLSHGIYPGGLLVTGKSITLASAFLYTGDENDVAQTIVAGGNPMLRIDDNAADTTVQGISFQNGGYGLVNYAPRANILNNRFVDTTDAVSFEGGGGVCRGNYFDGASDDGVDVDYPNFDIAIENNTILGSGNDGIEIRLHGYTGPMVTLLVHENFISGSDEDGIQVIDYTGLSSRLLRIERNVIVDNAMVGLGCMANGNSTENFQGAPMVETVQVIHNTFSGNPYAITGSDKMLVLNNIIANSVQVGLKRAAGASWASHNSFWNNGTHYTNSNVAAGTAIFGNPLLGPDYDLEAGSACIDTGADAVLWNGVEVDAPAYKGPAPDLGARETPARGCWRSRRVCRRSRGPRYARRSGASG